MARLWDDRNPRPRARPFSPATTPASPANREMETCAEVAAAIEELEGGDEKDQAERRAEIAKRAIELGCPLPDNWRLRKAQRKGLADD